MTGRYVITLRSAFGQTIEVGYSPSLLLLCTLANMHTYMDTYVHLVYRRCMENPEMPAQPGGTALFLRILSHTLFLALQATTI